MTTRIESIQHDLSILCMDATPELRERLCDIIEDVGNLPTVSKCADCGCNTQNTCAFCGGKLLAPESQSVSAGLSHHPEPPSRALVIANCCFVLQQIGEWDLATAIRQLAVPQDVPLVVPPTRKAKCGDCQDIGIVAGTGGDWFPIICKCHMGDCVRSAAAVSAPLSGTAPRDERDEDRMASDAPLELIENASRVWRWQAEEEAQDFWYCPQCNSGRSESAECGVCRDGTRNVFVRAGATLTQVQEAFGILSTPRRHGEENG